MRKNVLLNLCMMILTAHVYAAGLRQDIMGVCTLDFPEAPQISQMPGLVNYADITDSCGYLVQVRIVDQKDMTKASSALPSFYGGIVKGILRGYHGSEIGHKTVSVSGRPGEELEYIKGDEKHQPVSVCTRILLLGDRLVMYSFSAPYSRYAHMKYVRDSFFASLVIGRGDHEAIVAPPSGQTANASTAPAKGPTAAPMAGIHTELVRPNTFYFIISFVASIMLLAGMLYIIVRWRKKKTKAKQ